MTDAAPRTCDEPIWPDGPPCGRTGLFKTSSEFFPGKERVYCLRHARYFVDQFPDVKLTRIGV